MVGNHLDVWPPAEDNVGSRNALPGGRCHRSGRDRGPGGHGRMSHHTMKDKIRSVYESGDMEHLARSQYEMAADDIVQEWPQSGERIRGRDNIRAVNENYPASTGTNPKAAQEVGRADGARGRRLRHYAPAERAGRADRPARLVPAARRPPSRTGFQLCGARVIEVTTNDLWHLAIASEVGGSSLPRTNGTMRQSWDAGSSK